MGFKKFKSKNVFLSMILCSVASFSLLHADNLKECQSKEDKKAGCVGRQYHDAKAIMDGYYVANLKLEIPYKNDKINGIVRFYNKEKSLFGRQTHKMERLLVGNA